jgi:hypothetical protein
VVLERPSVNPLIGEEATGRLIEEIEVGVFRWLMKTLKEKFGDKWWYEGVPEVARVQCVTRRELEGSFVPPEGYLTLIDLRDIARSNWALFGRTFEEISGDRGKDKATGWLVELNDMRKMWAHPIKQLYLAAEPGAVSRLVGLHRRVTAALAKLAVDVKRAADDAAGPTAGPSNSASEGGPSSPPARPVQ